MSSELAWFVLQPGLCGWHFSAVHPSTVSASQVAPEGARL